MQRDQQIAIVDYGMGNLDSVRQRLARLGFRAIITSDPVDVRHADKLVLPGVGHFGSAMVNLRRHGLLEALDDAARSRRLPILGICLGMQLMGNRSDEGGVEGLGWIDADVVRFTVPDSRRYKVPHIGWGKIDVLKPSPLLAGIAPDTEFYFAHSFNMRARNPELVLCESEYGHRFTSAVRSDNLFGVQFHPEKSHDAGEHVLRNFAEL